LDPLEGEWDEVSETWGSSLGSKKVGTLKFLQISNELSHKNGDVWLIPEWVDLTLTLSFRMLPEAHLQLTNSSKILALNAQWLIYMSVSVKYISDDGASQVV